MTKENIKSANALDAVAAHADRYINIKAAADTYCIRDMNQYCISLVKGR